MTKECAWEDCNEQIATWQNLCPKHYALSQEQQKTKEPEKTVEATETKPVEEKIIDTEPVKPKEPEKVKVKEEKVTESNQKLPKLADTQRLIVSQVALKEAVRILINQEGYQQREYDELIAEITTLANAFYSIVVTCDGTKIG